MGQIGSEDPFHHIPSQTRRLRYNGAPLQHRARIRHTLNPGLLGRRGGRVPAPHEHRGHAGGCRKV